MRFQFMGFFFTDFVMSINWAVTYAENIFGVFYDFTEVETEVVDINRRNKYIFKINSTLTILSMIDRVINERLLNDGNFLLIQLIDVRKWQNYQNCSIVSNYSHASFVNKRAMFTF